MNLNKYLTSQRKKNGRGLTDDSSYPTAKRITCTDGFSLSVQATKGAYCAPRQNIGPWEEVEVGFPSGTPELIMSYAEEADRPTATVYCYVPIQLVEQLIELHGGMRKE